MKLLVLGASGGVGKHLVRLACDEGHDVTALVRSRETGSQVGRHRGARAANVAGAFRWTGPPLTGTAVRLVDDVVTTGATAEAAGSALIDAGALRVDVVALARA